MDVELLLPKPVENEPQAGKKKKGFMKKLISFIAVFLLLGVLFTSITAIFPILPYSLKANEDLTPLKFGVPLGFIEFKLDETSYASYTESGVRNSYYLPRYDLYQTTFIWWKTIINIVIAAAVIALLYLICKNFPKLVKKLLIFTFIGAVISLGSAFLPNPPGTYNNIESLENMHFGGVVPFVEQKVPEGFSIFTHEEALHYLKQNWIAPNYSKYQTHIIKWMFVLDCVLNGLIIAAIYYGLRFFKLWLFGGKNEVVQEFKRERLKLLPPTPLLPESLIKPLDKQEK